MVISETYYKTAFRVDGKIDEISILSALGSCAGEAVKKGKLAAKFVVYGKGN